VKIALFGSLGLIGSAIATRLRHEHDVVGIDRRAPAEMAIDLTDRTSMAKLDLRGFDAVIHAAGIVDEDFSDDSGRAYLQATQGMAGVVTAAAKAGVYRFCYLSSAHVYGPLHGRVDEARAPNPISDYAIAHFASEQILRRSAGEGLRALVLRPCAVFGIPPDPGRFRRWSLVPFGFPQSAVARQEIELRSSGTQKRNFVCTSDIADCVSHWLADTPARGATVLNPIGSSTLTILEFAKLCAEQYRQLTGEKCVVTAPVGDGVVDDFSYESLFSQPGCRADLSGEIRELTMLLLRLSGRP
jgi:UDP-glucose 4-epimerase